MPDDQNDTTTGQQENHEEAQQQAQTTDDQQSADSQASQDVTDESGGDHGDTFPRSYVEQLRSEAQQHRETASTAAARADDLAGRLWQQIVAATGRLADPADAGPAPDVDDPDAYTAEAEQRIDALLADKPHLAARRAVHVPGQGAPPEGDASVSLASILRGRA